LTLVLELCRWKALDDDCEEFCKTEGVLKDNIATLEASNSKLQQQMDIAYKAAQKVPKTRTKLAKHQH